MTEEEARDWILTRYGVGKFALLEQLVALVRDEAPRQNLVSAASLETIWARHIVDSAQLLNYTDATGLWLDIGTGAGFPGVVTALLSGRQTLLVEPRRRRVQFLQHVIYECDLGRQVEVRQARIEAVIATATTISARAVANVENLLSAAYSSATLETEWLLPKGRNPNGEVAEAQKSWHGTFHVEHSITDPESMIVVASGVSRR